MKWIENSIMGDKVRTSSTIRTARACAFMWWIGMNGFSARLDKYLPNSIPTLRERGSPGLIVVAIASTSLSFMFAALNASSHTFVMFSLCMSRALYGRIPPYLKTTFFTLQIQFLFSNQILLFTIKLYYLFVAKNENVNNKKWTLCEFLLANV